MKSCLSILSCFISFSMYAQINVQKDIEKSYAEKFKRSLHSIPAETKGLSTYLCDSAYMYHFASENDSILLKKFEFGYNSRGKNNLYVQYGRDTTNNKWIGFDKQASEFDDEGNELSHTIYRWNAPASIWQYAAKWEYVLDEEGKINSQTNYQWDTVSSGWLNSYKTENEYTGDSVLQTYSIWNQETGSWDFHGYSSVLYEYNEHGKETRALYQYWNGNENTWENSSLDSTRWDDNGNKQSDSYYSWNYAENEWLGSYKAEFFDYINGKETRIIFSGWDPESSDWTLNGLDSVAYTPLGNLLSETLHFYDTISSNWIPSYKYGRIYDESEAAIMWIDYQWDPFTNHWKADNKYFCYNSNHFPSVLDQNKQGIIRIYPNPAHSELSVEISQDPSSPCLLINAQGRIIHVFRVTRGVNTLNVEGLPAGLYFIQLQNGHDRNAMKVIIEEQ